MTSAAARRTRVIRVACLVGGAAGGLWYGMWSPDAHTSTVLQGKTTHGLLHSSHVGSLFALYGALVGFVVSELITWLLRILRRGDGA